MDKSTHHSSQYCLEVNITETKLRFRNEAIQENPKNPLDGKSNKRRNLKITIGLVTA